jgi:hypothetical protein
MELQTHAMQIVQEPVIRPSIIMKQRQYAVILYPSFEMIQERNLFLNRPKLY